MKKLVLMLLAMSLAVFFTGICSAGTLSEIVKRGDLAKL